MREIKFTAPLLDRLKYSRDNRSLNAQPCTAETWEALEKLFVEVRKLSPVYKNGAREIFCLVERGQIEDWADYEEYLADEVVKNYDEFKEQWELNYPDKQQWFSFGFIEDADNGYRGVWINNRLVLNILPEPPMPGDTVDEPDFVQWLTGKVCECIEDIKSGTYNRQVSEELAFELRTGTITRNALWEVFPDDKTEYLGSLTDADRNKFMKLMEDYDGNAISENLITNMTADLFFQCCKAGYSANNYKGCQNLSGKELYIKHADGRDEGLCDIDENSSEAFQHWYDTREHGGHPWEVCRGGNSTHVSLFIWKTENGFFFEVDGKSWTRSIEAIKFYLAIYNMGIPVRIRDGKKLAARLTGEDKIGIVPEGIFPRYCHSHFPNEDLLDFMNLPYENREQIAEKCNWYEIPEVTLLKDDAGDNQ